MLEKLCQNVLIASQDTANARCVLEALAARAVRGTMATSSAAAIAKVEESAWDMVIAEISEQSHWDMLRKIRHIAPELPVVAVIPAACVALAVRAMHEGCPDVLVSPLTSAAVNAMLETILPTHEAQVAAGEEDNHHLFRIVGRSEQFLRTVRLVEKVAPTTVPVLITGESGTGKELLSYLLHRRSNRRKNPYVRVNCAALSENLLESELFGHERGAFTGAIARHKGRFERAHGGTLLLDEISETTPRLQAELLRVLEQQDFERVGGSELVRVSVRVVSTSNRDLAAEVKAGRFRQDLYYRLSGVHMHVPSLRTRPNDIEPLVWHFVNMHAGEVRRRIRSLDPEMLTVFSQCSWPGNVRQLRSAVRAALILGEGPVLSLDGAEDLRQELVDCMMTAGESASSTAIDASSTLRLQELERHAVLEALRRTRRNQVKAAGLLGITDRTLREKLRRYRQDGLLAATQEASW
jgi:DNA-binding NtrC family response regulator